MSMNIVMIGAGNLATNLAHALQNAGHNIEQVYSRTEESARMLAHCFDCDYTNNIKGVVKTADLYILSIADKALEEVAGAIVEDREDQLFVHTAGSMPMNLIKARRRGVFYPMQSFTKSRLVGFTEIPIFIEASQEADGRKLSELAGSLSRNVLYLSSADRQYLHVAAVFASNFSNHCYRLCEKILSSHGIPFSVMLPLIDEVAGKVHNVPPREAQTGPASRNDRNVIEKHLSMLGDMPQARTIYEQMTNSIINDKL